MTNHFTVDSDVALVYGGMIGTFLLMVVIGVDFFRHCLVFKKITIADDLPSDLRRSVVKVARYARFQVALRLLLLVGAAGVFFLFCLNAFVWFSSVDISTTKIVLKYRWPRSDHPIARETIQSIRTSQTGGGGYLEIAVLHGPTYRSVRTTDLKNLIDLESQLASWREKNGD